MLALVVVEGLAVLLLGLLVAGLLRSHAEILRALHGLGIDLDPGQSGGRVGVAAPVRLGEHERAHDVVGQRPGGDAIAVGVVGVEHDTVLVFLSVNCSSCRSYWDALADPAAVPEGLRVVVVVEEGDHLARVPDLATVDVVVSSPAWRDYEVPGSPHVVHVDGPTGRVVGEGTAATWAQSVDLLLQAGGTRRAAPPSPVGPATSSPATSSPAAASARFASRDNAARIDADLAAAGIGPGHQSLYPTAPDAAR